MLKKMGAVGATAISKAIVDLKDPANAESTILIKDSSNPLVDTGLMAQTATWSVRRSK